MSLEREQLEPFIYFTYFPCDQIKKGRELFALAVDSPGKEKRFEALQVLTSMVVDKLNNSLYLHALGLMNERNKNGYLGYLDDFDHQVKGEEEKIVRASFYTLLEAGRQPTVSQPQGQPLSVKEEKTLSLLSTKAFSIIWENTLARLEESGYFFLRLEDLLGRERTRQLANRRLSCFGEIDQRIADLRQRLVKDWSAREKKAVSFIARLKEKKPGVFQIRLRDKISFAAINDRKGLVLDLNHPDFQPAVAHLAV